MSALPIATPLTGPGSPDRIAALVMRLEDEPPATLTLLTLGVRSVGGVEAKVIVCLADGSRHPFSSSDARMLGVLLRDSAAGKVRALEAWAQSLDEAADAADRQAGAILLGLSQTWEVRQPRSFGAHV